MPFQVYYETDFYRIEADVKGNLLRAVWLRNVNAQEIVTGGTNLYKALLETRIERALANAEALGTLSPQAKDWLSVSFYELLSKTNLKKLARILPSSVFHQIALESVVTRADALNITKFEVKNFYNQEDGFNWLLS